MSQAEYKKRLKALMRLPENQVCSDCPGTQSKCVRVEASLSYWASLVLSLTTDHCRCWLLERQPRWASLIKPPPGAPPGTTQMGLFCCLECSGSHRRLGVHIGFVRSINLDSCEYLQYCLLPKGMDSF